MLNLSGIQQNIFNLNILVLQKYRNPLDRSGRFKQKKKGPKNRSTNEKIVEQIVELRKKNHSVGDIKTILDSLKNPLALATINNILKDQGFAPLPRRTRKERYAITIPEKLKAPVCQPLELSGRGDQGFPPS